MVEPGSSKIFMTEFVMMNENKKENVNTLPLLR